MEEFVGDTQGYNSVCCTFNTKSCQPTEEALLHKSKSEFIIRGGGGGGGGKKKIIFSKWYGD